MQLRLNKRLPRLSARAAAWLLLLLAILVAASLTRVPLAQRIDGQIHDLLTAISPVQPAPVQITLIDIDERSLRDLGPWPWPRSVLAELARRLQARGATLQLWDIVFAHDTLFDADLASALASAHAVIGTIPVLDPQIDASPQEGLLIGQPTAPPLCSPGVQVYGWLGQAPAFTALPAGHLAATPDADGRLRRLPANVCLPDAANGTNGTPRLPQLTLAAAALQAPDAPWQLTPGFWPWEPAQWLTRGHWRFALDANARLPIPYQRPHSAWPAISASSLLLDDATHPPPSLAGHTVLIGATALGARDTASTPYHPTAPGVSVHAELLAAASGAGHWAAIPPRAPGLLAALLTLLAGAGLLPLARRTRPLVLLAPGLAACVLTPIALGWLGQQLLAVQLPITAPLVALLAAVPALMGLQLLLQRRQSQALVAHLQSFLPQGLAQQIATQTQAITSDSLGQSCSGTLAALRIDGLARWVSQVDSLQALALIHALHTTTLASARQHAGALEYAQGDTLYLSWEGAADTTDTSAQALACLRDLHQRLAPILAHNASARAPLLAFSALETGHWLRGIVGTQGGRRSVLLGPATHDIDGMLALSPELDSPILIGPQAGSHLQPRPANAVQPIGQFLLPEQRRARQLYRADSLSA